MINPPLLLVDNVDRRSHQISYDWPGKETLTNKYTYKYVGLDTRLSSVWLERPAVDSMAVTGRSPVQIREAGLLFTLS